MSAAIEIRRVSGGTQIEPLSKGWGPENKPDEWKIVIPLTDTPNGTWRAAWTEVLETIPSGLYEAEWTFKMDEQVIEFWAEEDKVELLVGLIDAALEAANTRTAELVEEAARKRTEQAGRADADRDEAARIQEKLDRLS